MGITLYDALIAADILEKRGISAAVADVRCVRPIDSDFMRKGAADKRAVVSIEDGIVTGGFGQQLEDMHRRTDFKVRLSDRADRTRQR